MGKIICTTHINIARSFKIFRNERIPSVLYSRIFYTRSVLDFKYRPPSTKTRYYNNYFRICQQQLLLLLSTTQPIHSSFSSINLQRCLERETHKLTKKIKVGEKWFEDVLGLEEWGELLTHAQSTGIHLGMLMTVPRPLQLQPRPTESSAPFSLRTLYSYFIDNKSI